MSNLLIHSCNAKYIRRQSAKLMRHYRSRYPQPKPADPETVKVRETVAVVKAKAAEQKGLKAICGRAAAAVMGLFR